MLFFISILTACNGIQNANKLNNVSINPQDIVLFFLDSLQHKDMVKVIKINDKSDTVKLKNADWIKEMDFLEAINTNKPAYKGTLQLDTTRNADTLIYHLTCNDKKLNLKEASIFYFKDQLLHMHLKSFSNNFLYSNAKEIYFNPLKGYCVKGFQKLDLISNKEVAYTILVNKSS